MTKHLFTLILILTLSPSIAFSGYEGLISSPDDDSTATSQQSQSDEPLGYQGLVSGAVPERATSAPSPRTTSPARNHKAENPNQNNPAQTAQTPPAPNQPNNQSTATPAPDLATLALARQGLADKQALLQSSVKMSPKTISLLEKPQIRIGGMLPIEFGVSQQIENFSQQINAPNLSPEEREKRIRQARQTLEEMLFIYEYQAAMPPEVMRKMGLSDLYIAENTQANKNAVQRIKTALAALKNS